MPPRTEPPAPSGQAAPAAPPQPRKSFPERLEDIARATAMAGEVARAAGNADPSGVNEAMLRLAQERLFAILVDVDPAQNPWDVLPKITRAVTDLSRTDVMQRKIREDMKSKMMARVDMAEKRAGADKKLKRALRQVREDIYGL